MPIPRSGTQFTLTAGAYTATIASVGATLRTLQHAGRDLIVPFAADELRPNFRGALLAPWPNRITDGVYEFAATKQQLALSEPGRGHAIHGLIAWLDFAAVSHTEEALHLSATLQPQLGYPHRLRVDVHYTISEQGLHTSITGANLGSDAAPWGAGPHPYLVAGPGKVDDWVLGLPAESVLLVEGERMIPGEITSVAQHNAGVWDFRAPRQIGDTFIDHAFGQLIRDAAGEATVTLTSPAGTGVCMSWDVSCPWVQVHTADRPDPITNRVGLAVEPMTCPPDAFNSGIDLIVLGAGSSASAGWRIAAL